MGNTASLPIGKLPFANQLVLKKELSILLNSREKEKIRGVLYKTPQGSGFTRFLEQSIERQSQTSIRVYIDAASDEDDVILVEFFHELRNFYNTPSRKGKQYLREKAQDIIDIAVSSYSDFDGPGSKTLSKLGDLVGGSIRSLSFENFRNIINKLPKDISIVFLIDNVHENPSIVKNFIKKTATKHYSQIFYIMGYRESTNEDSDIFLNEIFDYGINIIDKQFPTPDVNLIEEILSTANSYLPKKLVIKLLKDCNHNLHKVISKLRKGFGESGGRDISEVSKSIILYLYCSRQSLPKETIKKLIMFDPTIYIDETPLWFESSLEEIEEYIHINGELLLQLTSPPPFNINNLEKVRHAEILYDDCLKKFSNKNHSSKLLSLLFHLSKSVDTSKTALYSQEIIKYSLYTGSLEAAEKYYKTSNKKCTEYRWDNYFLSLCFLISSKRYSEAIDLIESNIPKSFSNCTLTLILKVVALNRTRKHEDSIKLIKHLLTNEKISLEQESLLVSFYIGGLIHTNQKKYAYEVYSDNYKFLVKAKNYGYFIRNSSGACQIEEAIDLSKQAINIFKASGDDYGLNTSMNNLGAYLSMHGDHSAAINLFKDSKFYLDSIGLIHLEEIYVNWGLSQLYSNNIKGSEETIRKIIRFSSENVPRYYAFQVLALLSVIQGRMEESLVFLDAGYKIALTIDVVAHRERYLANATLISAYCGCKKEVATFYKEETEKSLYSYGRGKALAILELVKKRTLSQKELLTYFIPPFMFYWSQEPIFVLDTNDPSSH